MADDERFGADGVDDEAARDDTRDGPVASGDGHDAALDESDAQPVSPTGAGADAEPAASELSAIFAAALADEPPSRVTAESVLQEVRGQKRPARAGFGGWLVSGRAPVKWAGGLVAVAALVAAVIIVAPMTGSSPDSASTAASGMYESAADGGASESSAAAEERAAAADSAADAGAPEAAPASGLSEMSSSSESSQAAPDAGAYTALSDGAGSDAAGSGERSPEATGPVSSAGETGAQSSPGVSCSLPALTPEEWSAAVATLPSDVTTTRLEGTSCVAGALRGNGIEVAKGVGQPETFLWLVVSQGPLGRDGAATDSTVVSTSRGGVTVRVVANQSGSPWLGDAALQRLVDAVADAAS